MPLEELQSDHWPQIKEREELEARKRLVRYAIEANADWRFRFTTPAGDIHVVSSDLREEIL